MKAVVPNTKMSSEADVTSSTKLSQFVMAKQWWKVCFLHGDQTKFYKEIYGKAASRRIANSRKTSDWLKDQNQLPLANNNKNDTSPRIYDKGVTNQHFSLDYIQNYNDIEGPAMSLPNFHNQNFDRLHNQNKSENIYTKNNQYRGSSMNDNHLKNSRKHDRFPTNHQNSSSFDHLPRAPLSPRLEDSIIFGTEGGSMHCLTLDDDVPKSDRLKKRSTIYDDSSNDALFQNQPEICNDFRDAIESLHLFNNTPPVRDTSIDSGAGADEGTKDNYT